ncbi:hypothetical protein CO057_03160 [Candidatus Uhrbacteria bacterium CG_4_9_14_0_2_um_filter_41_50]|uniref:Septum formation initiator n=1 Tax=Candidatus Uhrbacteria bacterium CG_4_9_14_0_2_um_filter_41_50 TaxID=1975031 RepID=A0A2M8ENK2_9BACT|nr:MAG: hypothetical protein COZ45_03710 [Candidatus Uhrbacteria bacterium CG_4_10_14_3_um_filter_41_21]PIZ54979.1 MAG: hypothetical protein COY24_02050 [Candidatus Uhrbacteria bacterium CG_4_10_14_0_2_um_filter_41_21]PJB84344.1 MAG: hypothetical protein CO086_04050 [Candidatus Uhrbacteria bacterium CG_4_9_14_0_8_um_filter_41_16]PJC24298.1 MAG: hypothetical protein CO057_03160 [Candidatus Uhrbacteria bacterium CG_4_9_14_0_2_um_filter_41_50]PJE75339.1 MAG: hypothetical protein COV03_01045 [Candi
MSKNKNKIKWFILINFVILFFLVIAFGKEYVGNIQVEREIAQLQQQRSEFENEQLDTLNLISDLSSEYYSEQEGRTKQGLGREGETLVIIQYESNTVTDGEDLATLGSYSLESLGNPARWFLYFFANDTFAKFENI